MITSKDHSGKPLISITDGKKLGEVKDLYLDQDMRQVAAVFLGKEGLISRKALVIPRSAVGTLTPGSCPPGPASGMVHSKRRSMS